MAESVTETQFGGWPFLDASFLPSRLLTAVACVRWARCNGPTPVPPADDALRQVLVPEHAVRIRRLDVDLNVDLPSRPLPPHRLQQVHHTLQQIADRHPGWAPLLHLPVRYRTLPGRSSISASSFALPQHVHLAERAFTTGHVLAEQLLHELCHQWLYLIEELVPLRQEGCTHALTLPSGTGGRTVNELLGALHVTAALRPLWQQAPVDDALRQRRLRHLASYTSGCLTLADTVNGCLTGEGRAFLRRLHRGSAERSDPASAPSGGRTP